MNPFIRWFGRRRRPTTVLSPSHRPIVEALEDRLLLTAYVVTTTADNLHNVNAVTLRDALTAINTQAPSGKAAAGTATNTISFAIGTKGSIATIPLTSALPELKHQAVIDGWTQGPANYTGAPLIIISGAKLASDVDGLRLIAGSNNSTVRGLDFERFGSEGIVLRGSNNDQVVGNYIGTNQSGTARLGSNAGGILIDNASTGDTIGGTTSGAGNVVATGGPAVEIKDSGTVANVVIGNFLGTDAKGDALLGALAGVEIRSGAAANTIGGTATGAANVIDSTGPGVEIKDAGTRANLVIGNDIGTDSTGTVAIGNAVGVEIRQGATDNIIGGTASAAANIISGNNGPGVEIKDDGTSGNIVLGNLIGTAANGTSALGNSGDGVLIRDGAVSNTIGGTAAGSGNTIAFNAKGIVITGDKSVGNSLLGNSIFGNTGIGIDLGDDGPTPNGANPRKFPNNGQNTPIITSATSTKVSGTLTSVAKTTFRIEIFLTPAGGTSRQGQTFLGFVDVMTASNGTISFSLTVANIPTGSVITATATNLSTGDTSEFSAPVTR